MSLTISDLVDQSLPALKQPPELFGGAHQSRPNISYVTLPEGTGHGYSQSFMILGWVKTYDVTFNVR